MKGVNLFKSFKDGNEFAVTETYSENEISDAEKKLEFNFPELYKKLLLEIGAGYFTLNHEKELPNGSSFESIHTLKTLLRLTLNNNENEVPDGFIPFGSDSGGSLFCFNRVNSCIYFVDNVFYRNDQIADNFNDFLKLINI